MTDLQPSAPPETAALPDLSGLEIPDWLDGLDALGEEHGDFVRLGPAHHKLFLDLGRTLLVTFESIGEARLLPNALPRGVDLAMARNWSLLSFLSDGETWFRDHAIWGTLDRLTDDGFFEDFDRVLFFGIGAGGYAAAAMSVAAPGARVLALRPQATLTPAIAGWDRRFPKARLIDFTTRYGYGPDMIDAAEHVDIIVDPLVAQDHIHASLYTRANVAVHRLPLSGLRPEGLLDRLEIMPALVDAAMAGQLDATRMGQLWRARRNAPQYLRPLLRRAEQSGRMSRVRALIAHGLTTRDSKFYEAKRAALPPEDAPH